MKDYSVSIDTFATLPVTHGLTWLAGIPCRIGFDSAGFGTTLTYAVRWQPKDVRFIDHQLCLLDPVLGADRPAFLPASYPGFRPVKLPAGLDIRGKGHLILHMGAGQPLREWVDAKWVELGKILKVLGFEVVLTGAPGAQAMSAQVIAEQAGIKSVAGLLSWAQLVSLVSSATGLVSVDTVICHVAACFQVPTVVLTTGRKRISVWHPNNPYAASLAEPVACMPCYRMQGCKQMACIRDIEIDRVIESIQDLILKKSQENLLRSN